ncbi:MAG: divergent polysaccharide deacetylase family protein [Alsobacter sp.]
MTLGHDELTRPLGLEKAAVKTRRLPALPWPQIVVGLLSALVVALVLWLALVRDPYGGEPFAIATIERAPPAPPPAANETEKPAASVAEAQPDAAPKERMTAGEMEQMSGVKVTRGAGGEAPQGIVIQVPQPGDVKLPPAPDKRLVERSRHGVLPKVAADGARPADVYARPVTPFTGKVVGRIALVVGGLGLSQTATSDAIVKLPGAVTLAFAPYGTDVERQAARAREDGHELMLQVPMEPFDYPDNDPGPHTLTTGGQPSETMDKLYWVMSRFPGYVGVMNYMGGKFTSNDAALAPVLRDVGSRGLVYLDDGTSARSLAPTIAGSFKLPAAKADGLVDGVPKGSAIDDQLARLETIAREKGTAIGTASALPVSVDRIAAWAKTLEAKGLQLVPVSAAIARPGR